VLVVVVVVVVIAVRLRVGLRLAPANTDLVSGDNPGKAIVKYSGELICRAIKPELSRGRLHVGGGGGEQRGRREGTLIGTACQLQEESKGKESW
jgi:hypothetical protein